MFTKPIKTLAALITSLVALSSLASAQWGMPDLTNIDLNAYAQQQYDLTTNNLNGYMQNVMQQRGPEIQAAYQQCQYSGGYCGSFEEYALNYVSTNGFTDGGAWAATQRGMQQREYAAWQGVQQAEANSANAINGWNDNYYQNSSEMGNVITGSSTWVDPMTGTNYTLPYTGVQPGQSWYDSASGYYFQYNPYNQQNGQYYMSQDGYYYQPMNPWQAGQ
jgi:hypothetical protein